MAERRMFTKKITESDAFLDMPSSTQALYFHLNMSADDDGFVNNPKKIQRMVGSSDDDMKLLIAKKFIIVFDSGIIVIKHWKMHNYIQNDRYKPTDYAEEKAMLEVRKNKAYTLNVSKMDTESIQDVSVGKVRLELGKNKEKEIYKEKEPDKDTAPNGANTNKELGSSTVIGAEVENKDTSFIATTALGNEQKESSAGEKKETVKQQSDNGTKASTTSGNLGTVKKTTEAEIIDFFTKTWEMYPRKVNKVQALKTYGYKLNGMSKEEAKKIANKIYLTLRNQIEVWGSEGEHGREFEFMPHFSTWLNANFTDSNGKVRCR